MIQKKVSKKYVKKKENDVFKLGRDSLKSYSLYYIYGLKDPNNR